MSNYLDYHNILFIDSAGKVGIGTENPTTPLHIRKVDIPDNTDSMLLTLDGKFVDSNIDAADHVGITFRVENSVGGAASTNSITYSYNNRLHLQKDSGTLLIGTENNTWKYITTGTNTGSSSAKVTIDASSNSGSFANTNNALMLTSPASTYISFASKNANNENIRQGYIQGVEGQGMRIANDILHSITDNNAYIDIKPQHIYMRSSNNTEPLATLLVDELNNHGGVVMNAPASKQTHLRFQNNGSLKWQLRCPFHEPTNPDSLRFYSWTSGGDVMTLKNNGYVGIGTTNPNYNLQVEGSTSFRAGGAHYGNHEFAATTTSTAYNHAAIEIREENYGTATANAPRLAFHWGGRVASQISIDTDAAITIRDNPGTGYEDLKAATIYSNGYRCLTTNDVGGGNGMDADTLDGLHASSFLRSDAGDSASGSISFTNSYYEFGNGTGSVSNDGSWNGRINVAGTQHARIDVKSVSDGIITNMIAHTGHGAGKIGTWSNHPLHLMANQTSHATLTTAGSLSTTAQGTLWGSSNDGSGSGLDADKLDGLELHTGRNNEVNKVVRTDVSGYLRTGWIETTSGARTVTTAPTRIYASDDSFLRYYTPQNLKPALGLPHNGFNRKSYSTNEKYYTGSYGWTSTYNANTTQWHLGSVPIDSWNSTTGNPDTGHWVGWQSVHAYNWGNVADTNYGVRIVAKGGETNPDVRVRMDWGATNGSWYRMFHDGYHPNADAWTTSRTLTLAGDATGSVSINGSSNMTLSVAVANDSHTHDGRYYTESESGTMFFRRNAANDVDVRLSSGHGRGLRFWDSDNYKIWMSSATDATWGGRLDGTSDYNMYFRMTGGTNRGFVFQNSTTEVFQIESSGQVRAAGDIISKGSTVLTNANLGYTESGKNYPVEISSNKLYVNVPWTDTNTTYSTANSTTLGLIKIGYAESGKNYPVELNTSGQAYVNVPWTDTNTTLSTEQVQDIVGGMVTSNTETNISVTYDDTNGKLSFAVPTDADTVDSLHASSFLRSDTTDDKTSGWTRYYDNIELILGTGSDFQMYFNGSHTYFRNYAHGGGNIYFQGEDPTGVNKALLYMYTDTAAQSHVRLYFDSTEAMRTTAGGIAVMGGTGVEGGQINLKYNSNLNHISMDAWQDATGIHADGAVDDWYWRVFDDTITPVHQMLFNVMNGNLEVSGDVISFGDSDRKLKDNLKVIDNPIDKLKQLNGYTFTWNEQSSRSGRHDVGVVAQEVEAVFPELVKTKRTGNKGVSYEKLTAVLIAGINEQQQQIEKQQEQIDQLNKQLEQLIERLDK